MPRHKKPQGLARGDSHNRITSRVPRLLMAANGEVFQNFHSLSSRTARFKAGKVWRLKVLIW
jgi:hypothetical protein